MNELQPIEKGLHGWKNRRAEILIVSIMDKATVPHCRYRMWQKLRCHIPISAELIGTLMLRLVDRDHLNQIGYDEEGEPLFLIK